MSTAGPDIRELRTPEGIAVTFHLAPIGDRVLAFTLDMLAILFGVAGIGLMAFVATGSSTPGVALSIAYLASFFLFNFYFILCELHWAGATPGKRRMGLKVISRDGGPLTAEAIFARNLTRDLEFFLPVMVFQTGQGIFGSGPGWAIALGGLWLVTFLLLPALNRDNARCGDLVGGTMVVRVPQTALLPDLAGTRRLARADIARQRRGLPVDETPEPAERYTFTVEQLDLYGIKELQVLEDLLRKAADGNADRKVLRLVCQKIRAKIAWPPGERVDVVPFLQAFYKAQRAALEKKMLFGRRQEEKLY